MLLKIVLRNVSKHWNIVLLAILGTFVATMLLVGGLSLNDSVRNYLRNKITKNFGKIDLVIRDKSDTIFLPKAIRVENVEKILKSRPEVVDFTPAKVAQIRVRVGKKYLDMYAVAITPDLERYIGKKVGKITISEDTAKDMELSIGDKVEIITAKNTFFVTLQNLGKEELNFRGETGSSNGTIFLPESLFDEQGIYPLKGPNVLFVTLKLPVEKHKAFSNELESIEGSIRVNPVKHRLATSPLNRIIGYLFVGFSGFSVISSFLFIAAFFGILAEERKNSLGILRALGFSRTKMFFVLFLEGLVYLLLSEIAGALSGIGFGKYLLKIINSFQQKDEIFAFVRDTIPYKTSIVSIIYAILIAAIVPIVILTLRSFEFCNVSPALLYSDRSLEDFPKRKKTWKNVLITTFFTIVLLLLHQISFEYPLIGFLVIVPLIYRKSITFLIYGTSIIVSLVPILSTGGGKEFLVRSGFALTGSIYIVFGFLPYIKSFFERFKNIPVILSIAYIERYKNRNFAMFVIYSVTLILILVSAIVPYSISRYIESKKEEGAFGYNFIIIENPLKTFFGSYKYMNDENFTSKFETIVPVQLVEGSFPNEKTKYVFILTSEKVIEKLNLPSENLMKELKKIDPSKIPDKSLFVSKKIPRFKNAKKGMEVDMTIKGVLPGISPKFRETLIIRGIYDPREALLPMDGIIIWRNKKIFGAISGYVGQIKDKQSAIEAQEFVARKLDGAVYVTGEIEKIYSSLDKLVALSLQLFYLGFFAGFAGLAIISFRNVYARKKHIGMLRAIGLKSQLIFRMFIYESLIIVTVATIVAIISSLFIITDLVNFVSPLLPSFKIIVPTGKVLLTLLSVFGLTVLFVSIPANISQRIPPSEALRTFD